jgi:hypothetical protein
MAVVRQPYTGGARAEIGAPREHEPDGPSHQEANARG